MQAKRDCKIKTYTKASVEDIVELEDNQPDYYIDQHLPDTSNLPNCPKCNSNKVAGIFYGSTPSGGHDDKGNPVPLDKPFHPCREFAESLREKNVVLQIDAGIDYTELYREGAILAEENYDEFMEKYKHIAVDRTVEAKIMSKYMTIRPMYHCTECGHNFR